MCRMLSHFVGGGNTLNKAIGHSEKPECQMWKLLWLKPTSFLPVTLTLHFKRPTSLPSQCQTSHLSRAQCGDKRALEKVCSLFLWVGRSCCGRCCCLIVPVKLKHLDGKQKPDVGWGTAIHLWLCLYWKQPLSSFLNFSTLQIVIPLDGNRFLRA